MENKNSMVLKVNELMATPSCCAELKEAGQKWIDAIGTDQEKESANNLIKEISADILLVDDVINFTKSSMAAEQFGAERAKKIAKHAEEIKAAGAKYCDCPACTAGLEILQHKDVIL
ncbi:methyl-accepting chemotaxis protein [Lachnospiraceae bacterium KM106-2]|nr:methyl-accepting chemotaxis protein [Lachnospiraceae bacterium KM106-2]